MRDDGRDACLRVLGLGPAASAQEIKAAYRDLAKVWHPDRFAHDPRLQQKAQEQLKEINEAYGRLASGDFPPPRARATARAAHHEHTPRAAHSPPRATTSNAGHERSQEAHAAAATTADERVATRPRRNVSRIALAAPALAFCATFAFITPRLLSSNRAPEQTGDAATVSAPAQADDGEASDRPADANTETAEATDARAQQKHQATSRQQMTQAAESAAATAPAAQPVRAMPTVTVSIDPTTGLRARAGCPAKSAMTFPAGDEPNGYCEAHTAAAQPRPAPDETRAGKTGDSRLKSFASRVASPAKKLFGGGRPPDKAAARDN